jgi:hypothetical protein
LIMRFGYPAMLLSASSAAICGCMILAILLYKMREHQARELSSLVGSTSSSRFVSQGKL